MEPDHDLMARAAQGDERAFRVLARRHAGGALRLARRILGSEALAEEIVQDALLRVWIDAPRWRPRGGVPHLALSRRHQSLPQRQAPPGRAAAQRGWRSGRSRARCGAALEAARARPPARRRDRCAAAAPARRDRAHLSGRARQCRGRVPCSTRRSPGSRRFWSAPSVRCAPRSANSLEEETHDRRS